MLDPSKERTKMLGLVTQYFSKLGVVGSMACGDQLKFQVEVGEDGIIKQAVFKAFGCGSAIASSAYATELVKGLHVNEASKITNESNNAVIIDIASYLKLPPVKRHCSLLAEEAIEMALKDFKTKNPEHQ